MKPRGSSPLWIEGLETRLCFSNLPPVFVPTDLSATVRSSHSIELRWTDEAVNEVTYNIYRSTDQVNWERVIRTPKGAQGWIDNDLQPNTQYFYRMRALAITAESRSSNLASATTNTVAEDTFATLDLNTNQLRVRGTAGNDNIYLFESAGMIRVRVNGAIIPFDALDVGRIWVYGYTGDDKIVVDPGVGAVYVTGGDGNDTIFTSEGRDSVDGGAGDDFIKTGDNHDTITGSDGNDTIYGQGGNDLIRGGNGNDRLLGGDGHDRIFGDAGNDRLYGEGGNDTLDGGGGLDYLLA